MLCKLVDDTFCLVVPVSSSSSVDVILSDFHNSALGGHLGYKKLLKAVHNVFIGETCIIVLDSLLSNVLFVKLTNTQHYVQLVYFNQLKTPPNRLSTSPWTL